MLGNGIPRTLAPEYAAVIPLGLWVGEPAVLVSSGRAIRTLADVAGRRIRVADPGAARLLELWGATPVILTANQILPAFQSMEIDAAFIGGSGIAPFQLDTVAKACTLNLPVVLTSF
jgi:TRAP-type C4-dicarboxylate transport system substrate-binding protein